MCRNIERLQNDYNNCYSSNEELKSQFSVISDFRRKINETESNYNKIHLELQFECEKNRKLTEENENLMKEIERLNSIYSGENSPDYLRSSLKSKDNEIINLK